MALYLRRLLDLVAAGKESSLQPQDRAMLRPGQATIIDDHFRGAKGVAEGLVQIAATSIGQTANVEWNRYETPPVVGQEIMVQLSFVHLAGQSSQIVMRRV